LDSIWTVGHSSHAFEKFLEIVKAHRIERLIDVRRFPASRKWPHFNSESLAERLPAAGTDYVVLPELGGRRKAKADSPHTAWRVEAFRGYADFMDTPEFASGLGRVMELAKERRSGLMCAEALPWRCHRSLIADALLARGWEVFEILSEREARPHTLPLFARLKGASVIYDGRESHLGDLGADPSIRSG
jgi:uncharacterized protein (DUF488 family)